MIYSMQFGTMFQSPQLWGGLTMFISMLGFSIYLKCASRGAIKRAVRVETGERHAEKSHIPDMGGIVMLAAFLTFWIIPAIINSGMSIMVFPFFFGLIGLADDIVKNRSQNTKGIPARYRIIMQVICAVFVVLYFYSTKVGANAGSANLLYLMIWGIIFIPGTVNAANFTDGLDGLLAGIALILVFGFFIFFKATYPYTCLVVIHKTPWEILVFLGIILAFLVYNDHPAKIFMGDGGSMFIGGFLACYAYKHGLMLLLLIMAFPMYFELISVVIQVASFKLTGKRVFPMTPIHHSFEKWGWSESNIVWFFYFITLVTMLIGVWVAIRFLPKFSIGTL